MPIFEYLCSGCGHRFETIVFGSTKPQCPACQGDELEKQLSTFAVGGRGAETEPQPLAGPCGSCGDPRGPGGCMMGN